jgi:hypothetical protein
MILEKNYYKKMNAITVQDELNDLIKIAEARIAAFHKVRKRIDSYSTVISALINKKVYQYAVDALVIVTEELNDISDIFAEFCIYKKRYFTPDIRKYLDEYRSYLECAALASEKRLYVQTAILQIRINKNSKYTAKQIDDMMEETDHLQKYCLNKAKKVNLTVAMINETHTP